MSQVQIRHCRYPDNKILSNPDAAYTVTAKVTDPAGNSSATSDAFANFTIDITAPGDTNPAVSGVEEAPSQHSRS